MTDPNSPDFNTDDMSRDEVLASTPMPSVKPFGYLRPSPRVRSVSPHGWAFHFFKKAGAGDVAVYLTPTLPKLRLPEPMTPYDINVAAGAELAALLDHVYEYGTTSKGVMPLAVTFARAIEAEVLRRMKEAK